MKNNSLREIASVFEGADSILLLTHVIMDGDTAGSAAALCHALRNLGKTAHVYPGESFPNNLKIVDFEGFIKEENNLLDHYDVVAAIDCGDEGRFEKRKNCFETGDVTINIDHHPTNNYYAQYNYVDGDAAAVGEIIFDMITEAGWTIDEKTAEAIYVAIVTDTGEFEYSSTTPKTHRIAASLLETGIDLNKISVAVYQSVRKQKYILMGEILSTMEFRENDRFAIAYADRAAFERAGAEIQDSDGMIEYLRDIDSVEVAVFVKETAPNTMKLGFRSKYDIDVSKISAKLGGGGHRKAAGCTIKGDMNEVRRVLYPEIAAAFNEKRNCN